MGCDFTEEVSLLVDGELSPGESVRLRAHVEGCASCKQSLDAFLMLRQELRSYDLTPDPRAQSKVLASILGSRAPARPGATPSHGSQVGRPSNPRETVRRVWERLAGAFGGRRLRPAHAATLTLLLIVAVLGVRWFVGPHTSSHTPRPGAPATEDANSLTVQATPGALPEVKSPAGSGAADKPAVYRAEASKPPRQSRAGPDLRGGGRDEAQGRRGGYRTAQRGGELPGREQRREVARTERLAPQPPPASAVAPFAAGSFRAAAADPSHRIGRHAERVERLFRSLRNARLTENDPTLEVADARRLSKRLLYTNIALRREAATAGDLPVEGLLESLEPILLDISNLPVTPSPEAVGSIKERIRRRQLVGVLQARAMLTAR